MSGSTVSTSPSSPVTRIRVSPRQRTGRETARHSSGATRTTPSGPSPGPITTPSLPMIASAPCGTGGMWRIASSFETATPKKSATSPATATRTHGDTWTPPEPS